MKTLSINKTPNYYLIILEDGGRIRLSVQGAGECGGMSVVGATGVRVCTQCCLCGSVDGEPVSGHECVRLLQGTQVKPSSSRGESHETFQTLKNNKVVTEAC